MQDCICVLGMMPHLLLAVTSCVQVLALRWPC